MKRSSRIINKNDTALVIVDVQEKLYPYVENKDEIKNKIIKLLKTAKLFSIPVVITEHYPKGLGKTIDEIANVIKEIPIIEKVTFSCCGSGDFGFSMKSIGKKEIIVCGIETHICVAQTVFDLLENGFKIFVMADGVSSRNSVDHDIAIERMKTEGAVISTTEAIMYELMENAGTPLFKKFLKLVKD
ncbi:MAG: hypothetical protein A2043_11470 [Candidatus Schekmanbacteria bacterium GWA2_38_9]|nr:MAG: hypothetical protein A2043_11470 [Candidatus Schekmanbacteria bacterium GWA2_38_9]